jgi:hypothetical protein
MTSRTGTMVPTPADPYERREPLPSPLPKSAGGDPAAAARVRAILESPSYRVASEDIDFLASDSVRGLRLQMDYLKPELLLRASNVFKTIVVFGSSRICEPAEARRRVEAARAPRPADAPAKLVEALRRVRDAQSRGEFCHRGRRRKRVVGHRVRQHDRMCLGVRQIERTTERVAKLVMQGDADRAKTHPAEPGAIEGGRARPGLAGARRPEAVRAPARKWPRLP